MYISPTPSFFAMSMRAIRWFIMPWELKKDTIPMR